MSTSMQSVAFLGRQQFGNLLLFLVCLLVCLLSVFLPFEKCRQSSIDDSMRKIDLSFLKIPHVIPLCTYEPMCCAHTLRCLKE